MIPGRWILLNALVVFIHLSSGCKSSIDEVSELTPDKGGKTDAEFKVAVEELQYREMTREVEGNGILFSGKNRVFYASHSGNVIAFSLREGGKVQSGQAVLRFQDTLLRLKRQKSAIQKFNAMKEYESLLLGYEALLKGKSEKEVNDIAAKLRISSGFAVSEIEEKELQLELESMSIKAPFEGVICDIKVSEGAMVENGAQLFRIYDPYDMCVEAKILEEEAGNIFLGQSVSVAPMNMTGSFLRGVIKSINPIVDEQGFFTVKAQVSNASEKGLSFRLFPGMNALVKIAVNSSKLLAVPQSAVLVKGDKHVVFTYRKGLAKWNYVEVGRSGGGYVEIKSGLQAGELAIISNNIHLVNDSRVSIVEQGGN